MNWEERLASRLKGLPPRQAPRFLSARIIARAALYQKPWHARPWWTWSRPAQALFAAAVALGASLVIWLVDPLTPNSEAPLVWATAWLGPVSRALSRVLWSLRLPLAVLLAVAAAPTAALIGLASMGPIERRTV